MPKITVNLTDEQDKLLQIRAQRMELEPDEAATELVLIDLRHLNEELQAVQVTDLQAKLATASDSDKAAVAAILDKPKQANEKPK